MITRSFVREESLSAPSGPNYERRAFGVIILAALLHLFYSTHLELVGDEAYYWLWSRHLDFCYLDKGPMTAWLIRESTSIFGETVFGIRFVSVLLASTTGICLFYLARRMFSSRVGFWAVILGMVIPMFAVGASLMTIDSVYVFFWSWAALIFWRAKDEVRISPWMATGVVVGLGLLSKYTAALELFSFALFCLWHPPARIHFQRRTFWVMLGVAGLFLCPAVIWNIQHDWPTTAWLWQRGGLDQGADLHITYLLRYLVEQAGVISPLLFLGLLLLSFRSSVYVPHNPAIAYALSLFLPLFLFYALVSLHYVGPPNWTAGAYLGGILLLAAKGQSLFARRGVRRIALAMAISVAFLETIVLLDTRWLHLPIGIDPLDRARGSRALSKAVDQWQQRTHASVVLADNYMTASLLSFYLPGQREVTVPRIAHPLNQLEIWSNYDPKSTILIVCKRRSPPRSLRAEYRIAPLTTVEVVDGERKLGRVNLFVGEPVSGNLGPQGADPE